MRYIKDYSAEIERLRKEIQTADAIIIGAGAGLSTAAGFTYLGERFEKYFSDIEAKYGFKDMYSGGFYPFPTLEEQWAYWSRYIYINRYMDVDNGTYKTLFELMKDKDYFVWNCQEMCSQRIPKILDRQESGGVMRELIRSS